MLKIRYSSLLWLAIAIFSLTLLPRLLSDGMFFDGVTYASIARNLADGLGTIWSPYYTDTVYPVFHEHPPLAFFMRSWLYKIYPDSIYVESSYGLIAGIFIIYLMQKARGLAARNSEIKSSAWSLILLFSIAPLTSWILSANLLELELTAFCLLAVILQLKAATQSAGPRLFLSLSSGFCIAAAFLTKGPVALFPLAVPFLLFLVYRNFKSWRAYFVSSVNALVGFLLPLGVFWHFDHKFQEFLHSYLNIQVMRSLSGARETGSRFTIIESMANEVSLPVIFCLILLFIFRKKVAPRLALKQPAIVFLLIGLSASLPILVSPKQSRFYFFPALPYFILGINMLFINQLQAFQDSVGRSPKAQKCVKIISSLLIVLAVFLMLQQRNSPRREKEFHHDFSLRRLVIAPRELVSVYPPELASNWPIVAYMQRQFKASLTSKTGQKYIMTESRFLNDARLLHDYTVIHPDQPVKYVMLMKKRQPN